MIIAILSLFIHVPDYVIHVYFSDPIKHEKGGRFKSEVYYGMCGELHYDKRHASDHIMDAWMKQSKQLTVGQRYQIYGLKQS